MPRLAAVLPPAPLDSRFRENDEAEGRNDEAGGGSTGATYPGSESGTCFRAKTGGGLASPPPLWIPAFARMTSAVAGTIRFRTNDDVRFADY